MAEPTLDKSLSEIPSESRGYFQAEVPLQNHALPMQARTPLLVAGRANRPKIRRANWYRLRGY